MGHTDSRLGVGLGDFVLDLPGFICKRSVLTIMENPMPQVAREQIQRHAPRSLSLWQSTILHALTTASLLLPRVVVIITTSVCCDCPCS